MSKLPSIMPGITVWGRFGAAINSMLTASLCGMTIYLVIDAHFPGDSYYNRAVSDTVLLFATMLLPIALTSRREIVSHVDRRVVIALIVVIACFSIATLASPNVFAAGRRLRMYYSLAMFAVMLALAIRACDRKVLPLILLAIGVAHAFFLFVALYAAFGSNSRDLASVPPFYSNVRHFGYHGFLGAAASVSLAMLSKQLRASGIMLAVAALFGVALFGSRGALLAWTVFGTSLIFLLHPRDRHGLATVAAVTLAALVAAFFVSDAAVFNTLSIFGRVGGEGGDSIVATEGRIDLWTGSLRAIIARPFFGYGPDGFLISHCCVRPYVQPHNLMLQFVLEVGVIGTAALIWFAVVACMPRARGLWRARLDHAVCGSSIGGALTAAILCGFMAFAMIDGLCYHVVPLLHLAILLPLFWSSGPDPETSDETP